MESPTVPAAPGQPAAPAPAPTPITTTATSAAVDKSDFSAFREARQAERSGKPLADVAVTADPAPVAAVPPKGPKPKDVEADDRLRTRVAEAVTPLQSEITRLTAEIARLSQPAAPKAPGAPVVETPAQEWKRLAALPDAPRLADFESVEEHAAAMSYFVAKTLRDEERTADRAREAGTQVHQRLVEQDGKFGERMRAAVQADPDLKTKIPPIFNNPDILPASALPPGAPITFANIVADVAFYSEAPADFLKHLKAHPADVESIGALPPAQWHSALSRLDGRIGAAQTSPAAGQAPTPPAAPSAAAPSPISAAPPPAPTLSRPGSPVNAKEAAMARGDFAEYHRIRNTERRAAAQG